eukprot:jgi/Tetstr1/430944/TSEL_020700.t1
MASRTPAPTCTRAWAEAMRTSTEPTPSERTRSGSPVFARSSSRAAGSSLWSAKTVPLAMKAAVREWHRHAWQRFTHKRREGPAVPRGGEYSGSVGAGGMMEGFQDRERRSGVEHHTEVGSVQRLASAAQLLHSAYAEAARTLADRRRFLRLALRDVPAGSSPASIW